MRTQLLPARSSHSQAHLHQKNKQCTPKCQAQLLAGMGLKKGEAKRPRAHNRYTPAACSRMSWCTQSPALSATEPKLESTLPVTCTAAACLFTLQPLTATNPHQLPAGNQRPDRTCNHTPDCRARRAVPPRVRAASASPPAPSSRNECARPATCLRSSRLLRQKLLQRTCAAMQRARAQSREQSRPL
jgi:hypothetical protein